MAGTCLAGWSEGKRKAARRAMNRRQQRTQRLLVAFGEGFHDDRISVLRAFQKFVGLELRIARSDSFKAISSRARKQRPVAHGRFSQRLARKTIRRVARGFRRRARFSAGTRSAFAQNHIQPRQNQHRQGRQQEKFENLHQHLRLSNCSTAWATTYI